MRGVLSTLVPSLHSKKRWAVIGGKLGLGGVLSTLVSGLDRKEKVGSHCVVR